MRERSLDSLRGIAAAVVVLNHVWEFLPSPDLNYHQLISKGFRAPGAWLYLSPLRLLVDGPGAVILFFVLSGLVLSISIVERDGPRYLPYLAKRVSRVWVPFAVAILISGAFTRIASGVVTPDGGNALNGTWRFAATAADITSHLLMTGSMTWLDGPMWSLIHEMRISIIFPLLVAVTLLDWRLALGSMIAIAIAVTGYAKQHQGAGPVMLSLLTTPLYLFLFVAGAAIATKLKPLRHWIGSRGKTQTLVLWLLGLTAIGLPPPTPFAIYTWSALALLFTSGAGACLILLLCASEGRALELLLGRAPLFLGRISYSLYLTHLPVIALVLKLLGGLVPISLLMLPAIAIAVVAAAVFNRFVEQPAAKLGQRLAIAVDRTPASIRHSESVERS